MDHYGPLLWCYGLLWATAMGVMLYCCLLLCLLWASIMAIMDYCCGWHGSLLWFMDHCGSLLWVTTGHLCWYNWPPILPAISNCGPVLWVLPVATGFQYGPLWAAAKAAVSHCYGHYGTLLWVLWAGMCHCYVQYGLLWSSAMFIYYGLL